MTVTAMRAVTNSPFGELWVNASKTTSSSPCDTSCASKHSYLRWSSQMRSNSAVTSDAETEVRQVAVRRHPGSVVLRTWTS